MKFELIPVKHIVPDPNNPRGTMDEIASGESFDWLVHSIETAGVLVPLVVYPEGAKYRLVAGHRRLAAAKKLQLATVPVLVREKENAATIQIVENLQRENLHPYDEAVAIAQLHTEKKMSYAEIGRALGRSEAWVWDRLRLMFLIQPLRDDFRADRFTLSHAIILARLQDAEQKFIRENVLYVEDTVLSMDQAAEMANKKWVPPTRPISVNALKDAIEKKVRFAIDDMVAPQLFPETTKAVAEAQAEKKKVIEITHDYMLDANARRDTRTFTSKSWRMADTRKGAKACEHSVLGVVVAGADQGSAYQVCIRRDKCKVHWGAEIKEKAKIAAVLEKGGATKASAQREAQAKVEAERDAARRKQEEFKERYLKARPEIRKRIIARFTEGFSGAMLFRIMDTRSVVGTITEINDMPDVAHQIALVEVLNKALDEWSGPFHGPSYLKRFLGVKIDDLLRDPKETTKPKAKAKKKGGKKG